MADMTASDAGIGGFALRLEPDVLQVAASTRKAPASFRAMRLIATHILCTLSVSLLVPAVVQGQARSGQLKVAWTGEYLTVEATDVRVAEVLREVERQTGCKFIGLERVSATVSIQIRNETLLAGVRMLLLDLNYVLLPGQAGEPGPMTAWLHGPRLVAPHIPEPASDRVTTQSASTTLPPDIEFQSASTIVASVDADDDEEEEDLEEAEDETSEERQTASSDADAAPVASEHARSDIDEDVAQLEASGFFQPNAPAGSLLAAAQAENPEVRLRALQTLALSDPVVASRALQQAVSDPDIRVRGTAISMMVRLGGPDVVSRLSELLQHADASVRFAAAGALAQQRGADADFQLRRALYDSDPSVRGLVSELLQAREAQQRGR
jgi:hypothetical protein